MGDTKRGREEKGRTKDEQRRRREIERELDAEDEAEPADDEDDEDGEDGAAADRSDEE